MYHPSEDIENEGTYHPTVKVCGTDTGPLRNKTLSTQNMNLRILISGVATFVPGGGLDTIFFSSERIELYRQHRPVFASFPQGYASSYFA